MIQKERKLYKDITNRNKYIIRNVNKSKVNMNSNIELQSEI